MEVSIFANRLLGLLLKTKSYRAGLLVHMLYSHEISKLSRVSVCDCVSDFRAISKHEAVFVISLKEMQLECIWRITCLEEDVLDVFPMGFDKRHDSESDKIVSPHWVIVVSLEYTWRQQVENLKNTHWRIESVLSLTCFFFKESTWRLTRKNCFFFYFVTQQAGNLVPHFWSLLTK